MYHLISAEWLKLTRRPLTWVLLAISLPLQALQQAGQTIITLGARLGMFGQGTTGALPLAAYEQMASFPGVFAAAFVHINGLGGIFAVILTAGAVGSEYSWGTLRTNLARQPDRVRFLLAKLLTILLLLLVGMLITLVFGALLGWALGSLVGSVVAPGLAALAALPLAVLRASFVLLPYVLLTACFAIAGRSPLAGVAGGLVYLVFEAGFSALAILAQLGGALRLIYNLTLVQNITAISALNLQAFGINAADLSDALRYETLPAPLQATLVVLCYCALFLATAIYLLRRRDVGGAT